MYRTFIGIAIATQVAFAQPEAAIQPPTFSKTIEDNSFFIEEAFNQEPGVVQHISTLSYFPAPNKNVLFGFTQEWPVGSQQHQLSFTMSYSFLDGNNHSGLNDLLLNYRYQLTAGDNWAAIAPRVSAILPTGNKEEELGNGVVGLQCNIPLSKRVSEWLIIHVNAGTTILPNVKGSTTAGVDLKQTLTSFNVGGSAIVLATSAMNLLVEVARNYLSELENGEVVHLAQTIVSPGIRLAIDVGELQIVPGLAVPFVQSQDNWNTGMLFYLSFEHPF